jgi:hypothetical protein
MTGRRGQELLDWSREVRSDGLDRCTGWAYEQCSRVSNWIMIERHANGSWAALGLCDPHLAEVFAGSGSELGRPVSRTFYTTGDFIVYGCYPTTGERPPRR